MSFKKSALEPRWLIVFSFFAAGIFLGGLSIYLWNGGASSSLAIKLHPFQKNFKYINPLLAVDVSNSSQFSQNTSLFLQWRGIIDSARQKKEIDNANVYFQDLETGVWAGINDTVPYKTGRLAKIPVMMAYYKLAEADVSSLNQRLVFMGPDRTNGQPFAPVQTLEIGKGYSIDELIQRMIELGDDNAAWLLFNNLDKNLLNEIYSDLGMTFDSNNPLGNSSSLKTSSLLYRVLYNATYLNAEYSEKAFELLEISDSSIGLGSLLPKGVDFLNRYSGGISPGSADPATYDMTDCGITFYPKHPYLICARVTGAKTLATAEKYLAEIGSSAYADIDYQFRGQ